MPPVVRHWLRSARQDLLAARTLLVGRHYRMAVFCCHLAMEKALKAILHKQTGVEPPRWHDLSLLLARTGLTQPPALKKFVDETSGISAPTRYPAFAPSPLRFTKRLAERIVQSAEGVVKWCQQNCG